MGNPEIPQFQCDACGRRYKWKAALAGREFRCACGEKVQCPLNESEAKITYDLVPEPELPPIAQLAPPDPTIQYETPKAPTVRSNEDLVMNKYAPLALLCGGVVVEIIAGLIRLRDPLIAANFVGLQLLGGIVSMLLALFLAVKFRGILLGPIWIVILKLSAISIGPPAVVDLAYPLLKFVPCGLGVVVGLIGEFALYFALLGAFFDLDESDTWYCVGVIFVINVAFMLLLRWL